MEHATEKVYGGSMFWQDRYEPDAVPTNFFGTMILETARDSPNGYEL